MAYTDYDVATGSGGTLKIRDYGSTVEFWVHAGSTVTHVNPLNWSWEANGTVGSGGVNYPTGAPWIMVASITVTTSQTVKFNIGATGTSGLGGPTSNSVALIRGGLAYTDSTYYAINITANSFSTAHVIADGNGSALVDLMVELNTSPAASGVYYQVGSWGDAYVGGLTRYTDYWFRVRVANANYGWGGWGEWKSVKTLAQNPSAPGASVDQITPTTASVTLTASSDNGGATIDVYEVYVLSNNAYPGAGGTVVASASSGLLTAAGLIPSTQYYYTSRARNVGGLWSTWTAMQAFTTLPSALINLANIWKNAIPYVCTAPGVWAMAIPYKNVANIWKQ